jgi:hypothetical protein
MKDCVPFNSHCARETADIRLQESGPERLTVKEIKAELIKRDVTFPTNAKKNTLVQLLRDSEEKKPVFVSPEAAAAEKAAAGESLAVEHIAELAPGQARKARSRVLQFQQEGEHDSIVPDKNLSSASVTVSRSRKRKPSSERTYRTRASRRSKG